MNPLSQLRSSAVVLGLIAVSVSSVDAQENSEELLKSRVVDVIEANIELEGIQALSCAVAFGSDIYLARGWGQLPNDARELASASSLYPAAPLAELFTATAVMQLVERGEIELGDTLAASLEGFDEDVYSCTIEQLLSHTSGLPGYSEHVHAMRSEGKELAGSDLVAWVANQGLETPPGKCFSFSESNTLLLAALVAAKSEQSFADYVQENIMDAVEMSDTAACTEGGTEVQTRQLSGESIEWGPSGNPLGVEQLCSNAYETLRMFEALADGSLISRASFERMGAPARLANGDPTGYGFSFARTRIDEGEGVSFAAATDETLYHLAYYPTFDLRVVLLANGDAGLELAELEREIARTLFDIPSPRTDDRPLSSEERARYLGTYYIGCDAVNIIEKDDHLVLDGVGRMNWRMLYQGRNFFLVQDEEDVRIEFQLDADRAVAFVLDERGIQTVATRVR